MDKPFKTIDEQIDILKSRNLKIDKYEETKQYLLFNNYYQIINGCACLMLNEEKTFYLENSKFSDIVHIQQYMARFKNTILKFLLEIELNFKSVITYEFSKFNQFENNFYLNFNNYSDDPILREDTLDFIEKLKKIIRKYETSKTSNSIQHYLKNHDSLPFWVLASYLDFGQCLHLYKCCKDNIKSAVAKDFSAYISKINENSYRIDYKALYNVMLQLKNFRNLIAHNNVLFNHKFYKHTVYIDFIHEYYSVKKDNPRNGIYHAVILMKLFLHKENYKHFHNSLHKSLRQLSKHIPDKVFKNLLVSLSFDENYLDLFPRIN